MCIVHYSLRWLCVCGTERRSTNLITTSQYVCQTYTYLQECVFSLGFKRICKEVGCSFAALLMSVCVCMQVMPSHNLLARERTQHQALQLIVHIHLYVTLPPLLVCGAMLVLSFTIILLKSRKPQVSTLYTYMILCVCV